MITRDHNGIVADHRALSLIGRSKYLFAASGYSVQTDADRACTGSPIILDITANGKFALAEKGLDQISTE